MGFLIMEANLHRGELTMKKFLLYSFFVLIGLAVFAILFFTIRQGIAKAQIEREAQVLPTTVPNLEATTRLEILPLYENDRADESFVFGHGVSYLIRTDTSTILMDLGHNPDESEGVPALQNMQKLGITWEEIDAVVISHPHPDHMGGVKAWQSKTLSLGDFPADRNQMPIYVPVPMDSSAGTIVYSAEPTLVSKDMATTGVLSFPEVFPVNLFDPKGHEQGLVINVASEGLVLITGCGHPTLERLVDRAEALYGGKVVGVVGGLHYVATSAEDLQPHIQFLESRQPKFIALSPHDSNPEVLAAFQSAFSGAYQFIKVGESIQFP
jgi:7,8-dihydropterin-6-yl-methyl-4-(beta-D-ribofuranosyl)aminobenzene 5'-phosphate synthase